MPMWSREDNAADRMRWQDRFTLGGDGQWTLREDVDDDQPLGEREG